LSAGERAKPYNLLKDIELEQMNAILLNRTGFPDVPVPVGGPALQLVAFDAQSLGNDVRRLGSGSLTLR
jgi:hypothetical protein